MKIREIEVKDIVSKSNLPGTDFVINPYVGCPHACKYCYACFMKRFTNHMEPWGSFVDIKRAIKPIKTEKLIGKNVFLSSVTDAYNPIEAKYKITRNILEQLKNVDCNITITTKSALVLRDMDILKEMKNLTVSFSINTLDEKFKNDMDKASPVKERLNALKILHDNGIYTALFQSPMFPYITDFKSIINVSKDYVNEYWFENLNLRTPYKNIIMHYIQKNYPQYFDKYVDIYVKHNIKYWDDLTIEIAAFCKRENVKCHNYFHHDKIRKNTKN